METELRPLEPGDCAEIGSWIDLDPGIVEGMRLKEGKTAIDFECELVASCDSPTAVWYVAWRGDDIIGIVGATGFSTADKSAIVMHCTSPKHRHGRTTLKILRRGIDLLMANYCVDNLVAYVPRTISNGDGEPKPHPAIRINEHLGFVRQDLEVLILRGRDARERE